MYGNHCATQWNFYERVDRIFMQFCYLRKTKKKSQYKLFKVVNDIVQK